MEVLCLKQSEVVWMDSKQSKVQTDRVGKFQRKNCSTGLRFCNGFLSGLVASGVFEEGV